MCACNDVICKVVVSKNATLLEVLNMLLEHAPQTDDYGYESQLKKKKTLYSNPLKCARASLSLSLSLFLSLSLSPLLLLFLSVCLDHFPDADMC